jgi:sucrose-6-phosphate hydrolase SacC (GH32 family)
MNTMHKLSFLCLLSTAAAQAVQGCAVASLPDCSRNTYPGPINPSFETGNLEGWEIANGTAFGNGSVTPETSFWGGTFNQVGKYFVWGFAQAGDTAFGTLRSSSFQASSVMSFLVGGGYDPVNLYIGLVRESDGKLLLNQTGTNDEALIRITWDTSAWAGELVRVVAVDTSNATTWGHINIDDVRTGCDALGDGQLTFNTLGQANQPAASSSIPSTCLYALDPLRPQFHYTPYQGWINDPCGLIQWDGHHHLYSQFNPAEPLWGPMHWSHAESTDAVHWQALPVALYPPYPNNTDDTSGRYTGSAVKDPKSGDLRIIFTEATDTTYHPDAVAETVLTATSSDSISFSYYEGNPVILTNPPNTPSGFRDPKVFWDPILDEWKLVVGAGDTVSGKVELYSSEDLISWAYVGVLFEGNGTTGTMWECPNFFPLDGKWVLFYGGNDLGYYHVGTYNGTTFQSDREGLVDYGPDTYATQWYLDDSGRNLAITWMGNWDTYKWPSRVNGWAGQQSITRELFLRADGGLGSKPIDEVASLASGPSSLISERHIEQSVQVGSMKTARLQMNINLKASNAEALVLHLFSSSAESVIVTYNTTNSSLMLDTTNAGYGQPGRWVSVIDDHQDGHLGLDILIDRSSLEIFASDGTAMTATVWPRYQESSDILVSGTNGKVKVDNITLTPLGSSWS